MGFFDSLLKPKKQAPRQKLSARDQIIAQRDSMIRNGFKEYVVIANKDCCSVCKKLNKKHFPLSDLEIGRNAPPMHDGCKCSISSYENTKEYRAWLKSL